MLSDVRPAVVPLKTAAVQIRPVQAAAILRLKSWLLLGPDRDTLLGGTALPRQIGGTETNSHHALCVGPDEWLVVSSEQIVSGVREQMEAELLERSIAIVDLTDGLSIIEVQGPAARDLLAKGCGLDLHHKLFPAGQCAPTRFAKIPVIVDCLDESPRFELYVARSYSNYLYAWLNDAAFEFETL